MSLFSTLNFFIIFSTVSIVHFEQITNCSEWQFKSIDLYVDGYDLVTNSYLSLEKIKTNIAKYIAKLIIWNKILQKLPGLGKN